MTDFWQFLQNFATPEALLEFGGLTLFFWIIFAESGTLVGIFLPGESLLFVAGLSCRLELWHHSLEILLLTSFLAAILGTLFGYYTGAKSRYALINRKEGLFFKRRHFARAKLFFRRYRSTALLVGRFFPVLRSLLPIFAGIVRMHFGYFAAYSLTGIAVWAASFVLLGYWCGNVFPEVKDYVAYSLLIVVLLAVLPVLKKLWQNKQANGLV
jgi:membrane-associated protein